MNITNLISTLKRRLGIKYFNLPVTDEDYLEVILEDTLVTFSSYYPYYIDIPLDMDKDKVDENLFKINRQFLADYMDIITVEDVHYAPTNMAYPFAYQQSLYDYIDISAGMNAEGMMNIPIPFEFRHPDKIKIEENLYGCYANGLSLRVGVTHHKSLATISVGLREAFIRLAEIDIRKFLYENLKHFDKVDTTFGQIDLSLDAWQSADDDRTALLNEWDETYLNNREKKIWNA